MRRLRRDFQIPISESDISDFKASRDRLVHYAEFATQNPASNLNWRQATAFQNLLNPAVTELQWMTYFMDRLLLSMLGYQGYFINAVTFEREELRRR